MVLMYLLISCGDKPMECSYTLSDQELLGVIDGKAFQSVDAFEYLMDIGFYDEYRITLFNDMTIDTMVNDTILNEIVPKEVSACTGWLPDSILRLEITVPNKVGLYELSRKSDLNVIFRGIDSSHVATCAAVSIDSVIVDTIYARVYGQYNSSNEVNGQFQAIICRD